MKNVRTSRCRTGSRRQGQGGNVLIEFALMSTLLLMLTIGVVDFGRAFSYATMAQGAAEAATQFASLSPVHYSNMQGIEDFAEQDLQGITGATATATQVCRCSIGGTPVECPAACAGAGESAETYVRVEVEVPFQLVANIPYIPPVTTIRAASEVRVQ